MRSKPNCFEVEFCVAFLILLLWFIYFYMFISGLDVINGGYLPMPLLETTIVVVVVVVVVDDDALVVALFVVSYLLLFICYQ